MTSTNSPARLAAASLAALFTLTACSSSQVFDFTESSMEPAESIEFRVPDELIELTEEYVERRLLDSVTLTAVEAENSSTCAVQYEFGYTDGGLERLDHYVKNSNLSLDPTVIVYSALTGIREDDPDIEEDFSSAVVRTKCATSPSDDDNTVDVRFVRTFDDGEHFIGTSAFFLAEVSVMKSGELFVHDVDTNGWQVDSNGNWVTG